MRVGIIGSMVWDRILSRERGAEPVEEWGGIAYALSAFVAARSPQWELVPIIKIGRDLDESARAFLASLPGLDLGAVRTVPEPNNRVELHYLDRERRTEKLRGGAPPWRWRELAPVVEGLDALYVNFISGWEIELPTAVRLRHACSGPLYADLHSLLLAVEPGGRRTPRPLEAWREWLHCFDIVQANEDELGYLAARWGDPWLFAAEVVGVDLRLLLVTLGERGSAYVASPAFERDMRSWRTAGLGLDRPLGVAGAARSERVPLEGERRRGDPTGCGDVWGATCFARLLSGVRVEEAMKEANAAAARNVQHHGATGLHRHLQGRIHS